MKYFYYLVGVLFFIYAATWTFNHVNPWIAILLTIVAIGFAIKALGDFVKKHTED